MTSQTPQDHMGGETMNKSHMIDIRAEKFGPPCGYETHGNDPSPGDIIKLLVNSKLLMERSFLVQNVLLFKSVVIGKQK